MSDVVPTDTDTVAMAFVALDQAFREKLTDRSVKTSELSVYIEYSRAVDALYENYVAGRPASGKVPGKRGRKAGTKNAPKGDSAEVAVEADAEGVPPPTETQTDMPLPTGRSSGRRAAA